MKDVFIVIDESGSELGRYSDLNSAKLTISHHPGSRLQSNYSNDVELELHTTKNNRINKKIILFGFATILLCLGIYLAVIGIFNNLLYMTSEQPKDEYTETVAKEVVNSSANPTTNNLNAINVNDVLNGDLTSLNGHWVQVHVYMDSWGHQDERFWERLDMSEFDFEMRMLEFSNGLFYDTFDIITPPFPANLNNQIVFDFMPRGDRNFIDSLLVVPRGHRADINVITDNTIYADNPIEKQNWFVPLDNNVDRLFRFGSGPGGTYFNEYHRMDDPIQLNNLLNNSKRLIIGQDGTVTNFLGQTEFQFQQRTIQFEREVREFFEILERNDNILIEEFTIQSSWQFDNVRVTVVDGNNRFCDKLESEGTTNSPAGFSALSFLVVDRDWQRICSLDSRDGFRPSTW